MFNPQISTSIICIFKRSQKKKKKVGAQHHRAWKRGNKIQMQGLHSTLLCSAESCPQGAPNSVETQTHK